jgi:tetratricopeptide (TPR) repeat protein
MTDGLGSAAVAVPVGWAADALAGIAQRWFRRIRRADDLSRLVQAAGTSAGLSSSEFDSVRLLLEEAEAWQVLGHGTVEDLADLIASRLPPVDGRSAEGSHALALAIARGMLEFAVFNLDPGMFQRVLLARLQRMETSQATTLDKALLSLHADLAAGFGDITGQLGRVLDQLPPGPAGRGEVAVYLNTMIRWLNTDPWPGHRRFGGPVLTPADIERKLRVTTGRLNLDADELAGRCRRLVILGGPGSGKTWFARRTARRCAEEALRAMVAGATVQEIELPLYTTCSRLQTASGDIRMAAVSSALDQLGDLGGSRVSAAIRVLFTERNEPTLLVADSLDEAPGSGERLRQADTLPWRVMLTSRPSSWDHQLSIDSKDDSSQVGELQPLRYPDDVDHFIRGWFSASPGRGEELAAQLERRPDLQKAATVPLILAFYCVVGGDQQLPEFQSDLYAKVLRRILTGRWRAEHDLGPDPDACLATLQTWAWSAAVARPVSGVGAWVDDFPSVPSRHLSAASKDAADHVAVPLGPPDIDTGQTIRRFIHRTIRAYLVAAYIADLPAEEATEALLPHLWHDPDWEDAAPTAVAMHGQRDKLLKDLVRSAARSDDVPDDLSVIDAGGEFRAFLARVATQSDPAQWQPRTARIISQARVDLAMAGRTADLIGTAHWEASNCQVREALLTVLADTFSTWTATALADAVAELQPTDEERNRACEALLILLAGTTYPPEVRELIRSATQLSTTAEVRTRVREALLTELADTRDAGIGTSLADAVAGLQPTDQERSRAYHALITLLADVDLLTNIHMPQVQAAKQLVVAADRLAPTAGILRQAREGFLSALLGADDSWAALRWADMVVRLQPTPDERRQVREILTTLLPGTANTEIVIGMAAIVAGLQPTAEERQQVVQALLTLLNATTRIWNPSELVRTMAALTTTTEERTQARNAVLTVLARTTDNGTATTLSATLADLQPTAEERGRACEALLNLLAGTTDGDAAIKLADAVTELQPTDEERYSAREVLLTLLGSCTDGSTASSLARTVTALQPTAEERSRACMALLILLAGTTDGYAAAALADAVTELQPTDEERYSACEVLLTLLGSSTHGDTAIHLADAVTKLQPTAGERSRACEALLILLTSTTDGITAMRLARSAAGMQPTAAVRTRTRKALLTLLAATTDAENAYELADGLARQRPEASELGNWHTWVISPPAGLLAAMRQESALADWLAILPDLRSLPGRAIDINSDDPWPVTRRGRTYEQMGRYDDAVADYTRAIEINPNNPSAFTDRGDLYRQLGQYDDAVADFTRAIDIKPDDPWPVTRRGRTYEQMGRYDDAVADYTRAIEINPNNPSAFTDRGDLYRQLGRFDDAIADFTEASDLLEQYDNSLADLAQATIDLKPSYAWTITCRGRIYEQMGRYDDAVADYTRAIGLNPDDSSAVASRGDLYRLMGRYHDAVADFTRAVEINPDDPWPVTRRGRTYEQMGRYEEALADFTRAIGLNPSDPWAVTSRGDLYRQLERYEDALADLAQAIDLKPGYAWAITCRGRTYQQMGRYDDAVADFTRAIGLNPDDPSAVTSRGNLYLLLERYDEAAADFTRAIDIAPSNALTLILRGSSYRSMGQYEKALADFTRAIAIDPDNSLAVTFRRLADGEMRRQDTSLADDDRAAEAGPADV